MNEQQHNMTGAWALDALDDEERARLEEYLAQDPDAAAEARSFEETAGELARGLAPLAPRPELKNSVMARIAQARQLSPNPAEEDAYSAPDEDRRASAEPTHRADVPVAGSDSGPDQRADDEQDATVIPLDRYRSSVRRTRWLAVAAAALMVTTLGGLGLWGTERAAQEEARATIEAMEEAQAGAEEERQLVSTILASDDAAHLSLPVEDGGSLNLMYSREQQAMIIQPADLPALPSGSIYQLWLIDPAVGAESAGLLTQPDQSVLLRREVPAEASLGLTVEPAGGSEQPTTDPIAVEPL